MVDYELPSLHHSEGGYFVLAVFAVNVYAAVKGWKDRNFLRKEFPTLLNYTTLKKLVDARKEPRSWNE
jgi:hypothetical protein